MSGSKVVITTFKNEAPYILEWVAHYRSLGFDHIVVLTNDCTDGTNAILTRLQEMGELTFEINEVGRGGIHRSALRQAKRLEVVQNAEWLLVCDIDEFLNIHVGDHTVDALIKASGGEDVDAIAIPWKLFSNNGRSVLRDQLVTRQFTDAELPPVAGGATRRFVKTLFRQSEKIARIGLHAPLLREGAEDAFRWAVPGAAKSSRTNMGGHITAPFGYDTAQMNHYAVRSVESYLLKKHRGRANHSNDVLSTEYWDRWNRGGAEDLTIQRYDPPVAERLGLYKEDPQLSRLHRRGFRWHKHLVETLKQEPEYAELSRACGKRLTTVAPQRERPKPGVRAAVPMAAALEMSGPQAPVGALWIGARLSYLEQMCLTSFARQGHPVTLFTYGAVENVPDEVEVVDAREVYEPASNPEDPVGLPVVQTDVFRLQMIAQTGLIWAETDMLCLKPIQPDHGHVHGYVQSHAVGNALLGLPQDSEALSLYLDYVSDPYPIPPWWEEATRRDAEKLKAKGLWKHASEQSHDVYGAPALTHFLGKTGELSRSRPLDTFYPVAPRSLDNLITQPEDGVTAVTDTAVAVHLWARRLRWRLPQTGLQPGSFLYNRLADLEINPEIAPLPAPKAPDTIAPAQVLPRSVTVEQITEAVERPLPPRERNALQDPQMDAAIRLAEHVLKVAEAENLFGLHDAVPAGFGRGIDSHGTGANGVFHLAYSIHRYTVAHKRLPDLLRPKGTMEKLLIWKHFGLMPIPTPADRLAAQGFVPRHLQHLLLPTERVWLSPEPNLPRSGELADGDYLLKASHRSGATPVSYPLAEDAHVELFTYCQDRLTPKPGYGADGWWSKHIPPLLFLERQIAGGGTIDWPVCRFWTVAGQVIVLEHELDGQVSLHDRGFADLGLALFAPLAAGPVTQPDGFSAMLTVAEAVGAGLDFAQVSFWATPDGPVLQEIDLCPAGATRPIRSPEIDRMLSHALGQTALLGAAGATGRAA